MLYYLVWLWNGFVFGNKMLNITKVVGGVL